MNFEDNFCLNFRGKTEFGFDGEKIKALRFKNKYWSDFDLDTVFRLSDVKIHKKSQVIQDKAVSVVEEKVKKNGGRKKKVKKMKKKIEKKLEHRFGVSFHLNYNFTSLWDNTLTINNLSFWYLNQKSKFWLT